MNLLVFNLKTDADADTQGFTTRWLRGLAKHRDVDHIDVITMFSGRIELPDNVRVLSAGRELGLSEFRRGLRFYRHLLTVLTSRRIDACFSHMAPIFTLLALPVLRLLRIPIVSWYSHLEVSRRADAALRRSEAILTAAPEVVARYPERSQLMNHAVDVSRFTGLKLPVPTDATAVIATIGRLSPVKDCATLVRAASILAEGRIEGRLEVRFYGDSPERDRAYRTELDQLVTALGLEHVVRFMGSIPSQEVPAALESATAFVNMQEAGGKGKAVLEAMAASCPTILCTSAFDDDLSEWREFTRFEAGNPIDLAETVERVLGADREVRTELASTMRRIAEQHSLEDLLDRVVAVLQEAAVG